MIRLAVADDHPIIIDGLMKIFAQAPNFEFVHGVDNGRKLIEALDNESIDVVLMDVRMPVMDGLECTKYLRDHFPEIKVIGLTMYDDPGIAKRFVKNGAKGVLLKNSPKAQIVEAINTVFNGDIHFDQSILHKFLNINTHDPSAIIKKEDLTNRELEVVQCICDEMTNAEIADHMCISQHTVESHRANVSIKLGVKNTAGLVKWAVKVALIDP